MTTEVLGRPVTGEICQYGKPRREQRPDEEFLDLLDALLGQPGVHSVRWRQYTPYFNDGDACEFGIGEAYVRLASADDVVADDEEECGDYEDGYIGTWEMRVDRNGWRDDAIKPELVGAAAALKELNCSFAYFENFLKRSFGDHAIVTASTSGFDVEYYEHD